MCVTETVCHFLDQTFHTLSSFLSRLILASSFLSLLSELCLPDKPFMFFFLKKKSIHITKLAPSSVKEILLLIYIHLFKTGQLTFLIFIISMFKNESFPPFHYFREIPSLYSSLVSKIKSLFTTLHALPVLN